MSKAKTSDKEISEDIKRDFILANMLYQDEFKGLNKDISEQELNEHKEFIKTFICNNIDDTLTPIINDDYFITLLARATCNNSNFCIEDLERATLYERYNWYKEGIAFFDDPNAYDILNEYGAIVSKDDDGFYKLNDAIINKVIRDSNFYISNTEAREHIKDEIFNVWENQKEILTQENLNQYSEKQNGINFKHFIFCEEYLKRGKIKPTCEYLGISRNTAYLWLKDEKVQTYLKSRQDEIRQETDNTFLSTYRACFDELNELITTPNIMNDTKIKAIDTFLKHYANIERLKQPSTTYED